MKIGTFEDIISWQKSQDLAKTIYELFRNNRDYGFKDQIQRAVVSISNNIAEGFERKGNNEFKQFLFIAKGSCAEVRSMSNLALSSEYISQKDFEEIHAKAVEISKLISGLIKTL
ncbi:MAG: four helix bundle protein [bacterium]|nr:four helix bundle protein [bacterium]